MPLNRESLLEQYQTAAKMVAQQRGAIAQDVAGAKTFSEQLSSKIAEREVSPEARRREKEVISQLFGAPESMRARLAETQLLPSEVGGLVSDRMSTYLDQLDSIRDSRSNRQDRIDNIVKSAATGVEAGAELSSLQFDALVDQRDTLWDQYKESVRQIEHQESLANSRLNNVNKLAIQNNIIQKFNDQIAEEAKNPGWDGGFNPQKYVELLNEAEYQLGEDGREWFMRKFSPTGVIVMKDENIKALQSGGVSVREITAGMTNRELYSQMAEDLDDAETEEDFLDRMYFYNDIVNITGDPLLDSNVSQYQELFRSKLIKKFEDVEGNKIFNRIFFRIEGTSGEEGENVRYVTPVR